MTKNILKRAVAAGCLALALFCVVKTEDGKKKPIVMKQMAAAEELVGDFENDLYIDGQNNDTSVNDGSEGKVELDENKDENDDVEFENGNDITDDQNEENGNQEWKEDNQEAISENNTVLEGGDGSSTVIEYEDEENISICVFGRAHTSVSPDSAMIFARIETLDKDIAASKENNFQVFEKVVSAVSDKGFDKENIKLEFFSCQPSYDYSSGKSLNGYYSTTSFSICCVDVDEVSEYITVLTENGVTAIDNISYRVSDMDNQYNLALSQAIDNARVKAEQMAGEGLNLVRLKEEYVYSTNSVMRTFADNLAPTDYLGKVEIEAQVMAVFEK